MTHVDEPLAQTPQRPELSEELVALLTGHLNVKAGPDELSPATTFESLGLDSLSLMELVLAAEEEFGIVLPETALDLRLASTLGEADEAFEHVS
ncbi:acyl carrier protein [Streptomyces aureocirculatus]|uniref:acyl carrier protein n=1 Tax=Streptomyces aureocirculatus TaxID=67275 RepID=UPI0004C9D15D|nr:acyl carrier protein [Streptomyces aureocirculatus]